MQPEDNIELDEVSQRITTLSSTKASLIEQFRQLSERSREVRSRIRELSASVKSDREKLNLYRDQMKDFKESRSATLAEIREVRKKATSINEKLRKFDKGLPRESIQDMTQRLKQIEWKLQTERLTRQEEKAFIDNIRILESRLKTWKQASSVREEQASLFKTIATLKSRLDELNKTREHVSPEFNPLREKINGMVEARSQLFNEIENINKSMIEIGQTLGNTNTEIQTLRERRREIVKQRKRLEEETVIEKERNILEKARNEAKQKLAVGKKLTFEELKLALGDENG